MQANLLRSSVLSHFHRPTTLHDMIGINETGQQKVNTPFELLFLLSSTLKMMVGKKPIGLHYFFGNFEFRYRLIQVKSKVMRSRSCYTQNKKN